MSEKRRQPAPVIFALVEDDGTIVSFHYKERDAVIEKQIFTDQGINIRVVRYDPKGNL